jgi:hypothetical protein
MKLFTALRVLSCVIKHRAAVRGKSTEISVEHAASVFRSDNKPIKKPEDGSDMFH